MDSSDLQRRLKDVTDMLYLKQTQVRAWLDGRVARWVTDVGDRLCLTQACIGVLLVGWVPAVCSQLHAIQRKVV